MPLAKVTFQKLIQDSQEYGSNDEHMVSRVFFDLEFGGKVYKNLYINIKQTVGGSFESEPLEIGNAEGYEGPFNYKDFRDGVEKYYRSLVGSKGSGIHISGGSNIRMQNNTFSKQQSLTFNVNIDS
ncbi:MAG: hypothetical protein PHU23_02840 [Dehalococcoidales bacterium]|nr:hypothetical protein [Dehalococcoidales bacterium]